MGLNWFDAAKAKEFGNSLGVFFIQKIPFNDSQTMDDKLFARKTKKVLTSMSTQVMEFRRSNSLNIYKRAQLSNAFKWTLKEAGYSTKYVNELTMWLVRQL